MLIKIPKNTWTVLATKPSKNISIISEQEILLHSKKKGYFTKTVKRQLLGAYIRAYLTNRLYIFTSDDIIFRNKICFDNNVTNSVLIHFIDSGWYGFKVDNNILIITPENIPALNIKSKPPIKLKQKEIKPINLEKQMSFDVWLEQNAA